MGMTEVAPVEAPDTYGLTEYFVSDIVTEIDGSNVRVICGIRRGGHMHWLYSCVMRADLLLAASHQTEQAACEAFTLLQLMERAKAH
jgi:hypothetical protein